MYYCEPQTPPPKPRPPSKLKAQYIRPLSPRKCQIFPELMTKSFNANKHYGWLDFVNALCGFWTRVLSDRDRVGRKPLPTDTPCFDLDAVVFSFLPWFRGRGSVTSFLPLLLVVVELKTSSGVFHRIRPGVCLFCCCWFFLPWF